jgi:hypothetical protein
VRAIRARGAACRGRVLTRTLLDTVSLRVVAKVVAVEVSRRPWPPRATPNALAHARRRAPRVREA